MNDNNIVALEEELITLLSNATKSMLLKRGFEALSPEERENVMQELQVARELDAERAKHWGFPL